MVKSHWKRILAAGAAAAVILSPGPERQVTDVIVYHDTVLAVRHSRAEVLPGLGNEVLVDVLDRKPEGPGESGDTMSYDGPDTGTGSQGSTGTDTGSSSKSTKNPGPSMASQIETQGERGTGQAAIFGGAKVTMLSSQNGRQILSCIIKTAGGKLIVIDGGYGEDAGYLTNQIMAGGGHVSAWLLTHPHGDHVGAVYTILDNPEREMTIDGIYYSLAQPDWYTQKDADDAEMAHALINTLNRLPPEMLHGDIAKGYEFMVDDVKVEVMNNRYDISVDSGNNACMVYKVTINGKSIIFLGDLGEEGGNRLVAEYGDGLKADLVQMAHHGQDGVGKNVYQAIQPSVCLWPTPQWLWDNDRGDGANTGSWKTSLTKAWMNQINGSIIHYVTKDGDQTIE